MIPATIAIAQIIYDCTMPWSGPNITALREEFVVRASCRSQSLAKLCRSFEISRTTGYSWLKRYREVGNLRSLTELSRRPRRIANRTAPEIECQVVELRERLGLGPRKLAAILQKQHIHLAASTVQNILRRNHRIEASTWATWMLRVLLADNPLPLFEESFPDADGLSDLAHFVVAGKHRERKKAIAVVASLKRIPAMAIASLLQIRPRAVSRYFRRYMSGGISKLFRARRVPIKNDEQDKQLLFSVLHSPPSAYGINRTSWKMDDLHRIMSQNGRRMSEERIRRTIRAAGFRWRKAKVVLTSTDPDYRDKLNEIKKVLSQLKDDEAFFSIDEYGPFSIKKKGGRKRVGPGEKYVVPELQKSKGWTIITAALELSGNQVTHFYSTKKDTAEIIKMTDLLRERYASRRTIYLSWMPLPGTFHESSCLTSMKLTN